MKSFVRFDPGFAIAVAIGTMALAQSPPPERKIAVTSSAFEAGGSIPARFTCKGDNVNPPLQFRNIPGGTKSLALVVDDPDAPGALFTHWLVWNIDPATKGLGEKSVPKGASQGTNDSGNVGYGGPCPPSGTHRYFFRIFALDRTLDLKNGAKRQEAERALAGHVLARGELMGRHSR